MSDWETQVRMIAEVLCMQATQYEKNITLLEDQITLAEKALNLAQVQQDGLRLAELLPQKGQLCFVALRHLPLTAIFAQQLVNLRLNGRNAGGIHIVAAVQAVLHAAQISTLDSYDDEQDDLDKTVSDWETQVRMIAEGYSWQWCAHRFSAYSPSR